MGTNDTHASLGKTRSIVCTIGMIFALLTILAIASALAIRLLEMDDPKDKSSFPFNMLSIDSLGDSQGDEAAARQRLWILALADLALAIASAAFAFAAGRARNLAPVTLMLVLGGGTTAVAFMLVWPLGAIASMIPVMGIVAYALTRAQGSNKQ